MEITKEYIPGVCNIGKEEVNKRKRFFAFTALSVLLFTYFTLEHIDSSWMRFFLFCSTTGLMVAYLQIKNRFCVSYGMFGIYNFSKPGKGQKVTNNSFLAEDRKKSLKMIILSLVIGLLFTLLIAFVSTLLH